MRSRVVTIHDADDPRVAPYRDIRERDLVGRQGLFIAEGKVVIDMLVRSQLTAPQSFLVLENRLAGMVDILERAPGTVPIYVASRPIMNAIAGFDIHRGVLAAGKIPVSPEPTGWLSALPRSALVIALSGLANHDNMGAMFRNAAAFGVDGLLLDETCCDPFYRKSIRVSSGHVLRMPFARTGTAANTVDQLESAGFTPAALSPRGAIELREFDPGHRIALVLGAEGNGLPQEILDRTTTIRIAMAAGVDSLNVATSAAIALYRLATALDRSGRY